MIQSDKYKEKRMKCTQKAKKKQSERKVQSLFKELVARNFSYLVGENGYPGSRSQKTPKRVNPKKVTLRHIINKLSKNQRQTEF